MRLECSLRSGWEPGVSLEVMGSGCWNEVSPTEPVSPSMGLALGVRPAWCLGSPGCRNLMLSHRTPQGERLSRFGLRTETTGSVTFRLHCLQQSR